MVRVAVRVLLLPLHFLILVILPPPLSLQLRKVSPSWSLDQSLTLAHRPENHQDRTQDQTLDQVRREDLLVLALVLVLILMQAVNLMQMTMRTQLSFKKKEMLEVACNSHIHT